MHNSFQGSRSSNEWLISLLSSRKEAYKIMNQKYLIMNRINRTIIYSVLFHYLKLIQITTFFQLRRCEKWNSSCKKIYNLIHIFLTCAIPISLCINCFSIIFNVMICTRTQELIVWACQNMESSSPNKSSIRNVVWYTFYFLRRSHD